MRLRCGVVIVTQKRHVTLSVTVRVIKAVAQLLKDVALQACS